jgi:hypothetical protein
MAYLVVRINPQDGGGRVDTRFPPTVDMAESASNIRERGGLREDHRVLRVPRENLKHRFTQEEVQTYDLTHAVRQINSSAPQLGDVIIATD